MLGRSPDQSQRDLFRPLLSDFIDMNHELVLLANHIDWKYFEEEFSKLYSADSGAPAKPIRLMVGLLILKHVRNLSDENLVEQWSENNYYQYFCGQNEFVAKIPCVATKLVVFRQRIGIEGCELIFKESIRINGEDDDESDISADTTVQEKNITYPTDNKLHRKIIAKCKKIDKQEGLSLRQAYTYTLKKLYVDFVLAIIPRTRKKLVQPGSQSQNKNHCRAVGSRTRT